MKKIIEWFKSSASDFVLFLIFLVLLNFVGSNAYVRADLTKQRSYSLSKASKTLVKNLDEPEEHGAMRPWPADRQCRPFPVRGGKTLSFLHLESQDQDFP